MWQLWWHQHKSSIDSNSISEQFVCRYHNTASNAGQARASVPQCYQTWQVAQAMFRRVRKVPNLSCAKKKMLVNRRLNPWEWPWPYRISPPYALLTSHFRKHFILSYQVLCIHSRIPGSAYYQGYLSESMWTSYQDSHCKKLLSGWQKLTTTKLLLYGEH